MISRCLSICLFKIIKSGICSTLLNSVAQLLGTAEYGFVCRKNNLELTCKTATYYSNPLLYSIPVSAQALPFTTSIIALLSALRASFLSRLRSIPLCPVSAVKAVDAVEAVEHIFLST